MWPFRRTPSKEDLQGHKRIKIGGYDFVIRRINPLLDFRPDNVPQVFASFVSRRKRSQDQVQPESQTRKALDDMAAVIEAGVVSPRLVPVGEKEKRGIEDGITVEDLLRWSDVRDELYVAIIAWSLSLFRGVKGAFFFQAKKRELWMSLQKDTEPGPVTSPSEREKGP